MNLDEPAYDIIERFVLSQTVDEPPVPDEYANIVLGELIEHIGLTECTGRDEEDFLSRLNEFAKRNLQVAKSPKQLAKRNEKLILRIQESHISKLRELSKSLQCLQSLTDIKEKVQTNFEEETAIIDIEIRVLEWKQSMLDDKIYNTLMKETSLTQDAMKRLLEIVKSEKMRLETQLTEMEKSSEAYQSVNRNTEFNTLLMHWKKLQNQKNILVSD